MRQNLPGLTAPGQNGGRRNLVRSDDGHTGKSAITTPQSASLTAPLTQGSPCRVPHRPAYYFPNSSANSNITISLLNPITTIPICILAEKNRYARKRKMAGEGLDKRPYCLPGGTVPILFPRSYRPQYRLSGLLSSRSADHGSRQSGFARTWRRRWSAVPVPYLRSFYPNSR